MTFEYMQRVVVEANLEVDNVGDCVLQANNDFGNEYYLLIKTELGFSEVLEYGPCMPDIQMLPLDYNISYSRFEYNQGKLERIIDKFLNNPKRVITQAKVTDYESIKEFLVNPVDKVFFQGRQL